MVRSRVFGLFALTLCLVVCLCESATVSENVAREAVNAAQAASRKVFEKAKDKRKEAADLLRNAETYKNAAVRAAVEVEKMAREYGAVESIAKYAKKASEEVLKLHSNAFPLAQKITTDMHKFLSRAEQFNKEQNSLWGQPGASNDFSKTKSKADSLKSRAEKLDKEITDALPKLDEALVAQKDMPKLVENAQVANNHAEAIVAVAKIEMALKSAEAYIKETEQTSAETNSTITEMKKLYDEAPRDLVVYVSSFYTLAEAEMKSVSRALGEAQKAKQEMLELKTNANSALAKVAKAIKVDKAEEEAATASRAASEVKKKLEKIKEKMESAKSSAVNAGYQRNNLVNALKKRNNKSGGSQGTDTANPSGRGKNYKAAGDSTESPSGTEKKQKTGSNKETQANGSPDQSTKKDTGHSTNEKKSQPVEDGTKSKLNGEALPTTDAGSVSAVTMSVHIFIALIACAALH